jgi:hypothetical protein
MMPGFARLIPRMALIPRKSHADVSIRKNQPRRTERTTEDRGVRVRGSRMRHLASGRIRRDDGLALRAVRFAASLHDSSWLSLPFAIQTPNAGIVATRYGIIMSCSSARDKPRLGRRRFARSTD